MQTAEHIDPRPPSPWSAAANRSSLRRGRRLSNTGSVTLTWSACHGSKIKVSGRLSGKSCSRGPVWGLRTLVFARVLPGHRTWPADA